VTEDTEKQGGGRGTVRIIVAINDQRFLVPNGASKALNGWLHVLQEKGVAELTERGGEVGGNFLRLKSSGGKNPLEDLSLKFRSPNMPVDLLTGIPEPPLSG
jgi:hypothetical protein